MWNWRADPPGSRKLANWQTQFFLGCNCFCLWSLWRRMSLPTVATSLANWQTQKRGETAVSGPFYACASARQCISHRPLSLRERTSFRGAKGDTRAAPLCFQRGKILIRAGDAADDLLGRAAALQGGQERAQAGGVGLAV